MSPRTPKQKLRLRILFLEEKLRLTEHAADLLRFSFVPNRSDHEAVEAYDEAKRFDSL